MNLVERARRSAAIRLLAAAERTGIKPRRAADPYATHLPVLIAVARLTTCRRVLELGAGRFSSRLFLDRRAFPHLEELVSVENDLAWALEVRPTFEDPRATLHQVDGSIRAALAEDLVDVSAFDLVFCDDSTDAPERARTIALVAERLGPHAVMVVHDFEIPRYREASRSLPHTFTFDALNPYTGVCWRDAPLSSFDLRALRRRVSAGAQKIEPADVEAWLSALTPGR